MVGARSRPLAAAVEERLALEAPARRLRLALVDRVINRQAGGRPIRVLDAGCGDGLLSLAIARRHPDWTIVGVDLRDDLLAGARRRAGARRLANVQFLEADLTMPLPVAGFDVVLAIECLSEIADDDVALAAMVGSLAARGLLIVHVPEKSWRAILPGSPSSWREEVRHGYEAQELVGLLERAGLDAVRVQPTLRATAAVAQEVRDRIKGAPLPVRATAFPLLAAAVRLELLGVTGGSPNALLATGLRAVAK
jgi:SAM-dependent methyltransferase